MVWYYRDGDENKGPFSDEEIEKLVGDRTIKGDTWVWREGMEGWKKYEDVAAVDGSAKTVVMATVPTDCTRCGKSVGLSNLRPHQGKLVCEDCLADLKAAEVAEAGEPAKPAAAAGAPAAAAPPRPGPPTPASAAPPTPASTGAPAPPRPAAPAPPRPASPAGGATAPPRPAAPAAAAAAAGAPAVPASSSGRAIAGSGVASLRYASILDRFLARLIDAGVIVAAIIVGVVLGFLFSRMGVIGTVLGCVTWLALLAGIIGYEIYFLGRDGATIGKKMRNLRVVRSDGSDLDTKQAFIRVLASTFLGIGAIMVFFDEAERKALHDMLADTRVVQA